MRQSATEPVAPPPAFLAIEQNLRQMMSFFSLARANGVIEERNGVQLVSSGIDFSPFNSAMLTLPVTSLNSAEFEERVRIAADFFARRGERWSFWLCDDMLPELVRRRAKNILVSQHLRQTSEPPGMIAESLAPPTRGLPQLGVLEVRDAKSRADFGGVTACTFDLPFSICREIYHSDRSWSGSMRGWVGYAGDEPVTTCAAVVAAGVIGIYTVGTLPHHRKRGYSERLMRYVLEQLTRETGITRSILQATPAGYPMYHKMGYRKACQFSIFLSEH